MNRLRVKEIIANNNEGLDFKVTQYGIAAKCIPFNMTDASKAQLLAKWNNGKALQKLTFEVLYKLREALGCTYGELIGTSYVKMPIRESDLRVLVLLWIKFDEEEGNNNILDSLVKLSHKYKTKIDFMFLTKDELLP